MLARNGKPEFCIITPTKYLDGYASQSSMHLVLAHLVDADVEYEDFYLQRDEFKIMDNGAFERGESYPPEKLRRGPIFESAGAGTALHIRACAKGALSGARQHDDSDFAIPFDRVPNPHQFRLGRLIDRVEAVGTIERDARDMVLNCELHAHEITPALLSAPMRSGV